MSWANELLRMVKETSFLDVFEEMEEEEFEFEKIPFYQVAPRVGVVCEFLRFREGLYGPVMDVKLVAEANLDEGDEVAKDETVTMPLSRANLRIGVERLGELKQGAKLAIVNLGTTKIKSGKWKGKDCFDYRVKLLE